MFLAKERNHNIENSMTSLFAHKVAQPTKWRFLPKNLNQLVIFVIGLVFTWSQVDKNKAPIFRKQTTSTNEVLPKGFYHKMFYWQSNNLNRNKNQNDTTDFWHRKLTLKIKFWWFLSPHTQVNASPITKITSWLEFLGKNLHLVGCATVCGKSEVMLMNTVFPWKISINLSQLVIFVIWLAFTWVWGDKNRAQF